MKRGFKFVWTAFLTSIVSSLMAIMNIILCTLALVSRLDCTIEVELMRGSQFMGVLVYSQYIQDDTCVWSMKMSGLTPVHTIFILTVTLLAFSILNALTSFGLVIASYQFHTIPYYVLVLTYLHVACTLAVIIVEITMGIHFGIDFMIMTEKMDKYAAGVTSNYTYDMLRHGAFFLMCLVLKGFVAPLGNLILLGMLIYFVHKDIDPKSREKPFFLQSFEPVPYGDPRPRIPWPPIEIPEPISSVELHPSGGEYPQPGTSISGANSRPRLQPEADIEIRSENPVRVKRQRSRRQAIVV